MRAAGPEFQTRAFFLLALGLFAFSAGCLHRHRRPARAPRHAPAAAQPSNQPSIQPSVPHHKTTTVTPPAPVPIIQGERGIASWYGHPYHGRPTANGEIYNMYGISAAHRTLPFGTRVVVHDMDNGEQVEVRINDRGPFVEGRIIDLSYGAARVIGLDRAGIAHVQLEILGYGPQASPVPLPGIFAVQVGAFRNEENAQRLKALIEPQFSPVIILSFDRGDGIFHRVRVGNAGSEAAAQDLARQLKDAHLAVDTFVVRTN